MIAWEWLSAVALTFWIGILITDGIVLSNEKHLSILLARSRIQVQPLQWLCLSVLLVAEIISLILRAAQITQTLNGGVLDLAVLGQVLFQSSYGSFWIARAVLILGSAGLLRWTTSWQKRPFMIALLILSALILITYMLSGDVAQQDPQLHAYAVVLDCFFLAAQYTWFGGITYLGYILLPLLPMIEPGGRAATLTTLLQRFNLLMLVAICALFVSELYLTMISLSNIQQFISEPYGRALLVKWVLILIMIVFSAYTLFVLRPKLTRQTELLQSSNAEGLERQARQSALLQTTRSFRLSLRAQAALGTAILLCGAIVTFYMSSIVFANINDTQKASTVVSPTCTSSPTKQVSNLSVMLTVTPGKINVSNTATVKITDTRSGEPVTNAQVTIGTSMVVMDMGSAPNAMQGEAQTYSATIKDTTFSMTGCWQITLTIKLPNQAPLQVLFQMWLSTV